MLQLTTATPADCELIVAYIQELAAFEKLSHECKADAALIRKWLFSESPRAHCLLAQWHGAPAGFALYFYNFSTFRSQPGIYIEDVFVRPEFRRKGIARSIFKHLAQQAVREGCARLEWWVLDWNKDAIRFYESMGAVAMNEWTVQRITDDALQALATS